MSDNNLTLTGDFKDRIRAKLRETIAGLIPDDALDSMLEAEIKEFFHTQQLLTVTETKVTVDNPQYDHKRSSGYGNQPQLERSALVFGSKMTPFRQLVWSEVHQWLSPKVKKILDSEHNFAVTELNQWLSDKVTPTVQVTYRTMFSHLATNMAGVMFNRMMVDAVNLSHENMKMSLNSVGVQTHQMPVIPPFLPQMKV